MWITSPSWVHFHKVRADDQVTHGLLVKRFTLRVEFGFLLTLKWVPTADNGIADAVSRPARTSVIRLKPLTFQDLWGAFGPFTFDLMASTESVQVPGSNDIFSFLFAV